MFCRFCPNLCAPYGSHLHQHLSRSSTRNSPSIPLYAYQRQNYLKRGLIGVEKDILMFRDLVTIMNIGAP